MRRRADCHFDGRKVRITGSSLYSREMKKNLLSAIALILLSSVVLADPRILPMRERADVIDRWLTQRVQTVLPALMQRTRTAGRHIDGPRR